MMARPTRPSRTVIAFALVLPALAFGQPLALAGEDVPSWTVGDFWAYSGDDGLLGATEIRVEVTAVDSVTVGNETHLTYTTERTVRRLGTTHEETRWYRTSDLGLVGYETESSGGRVVFNPPLEMEWPLHAGAAWTGRTTGITVNSSFSQNYSYVVGQQALLVVPAGTFEAFEIRQGIALWPPYAEHFAPTVGNWVRINPFRGAFHYWADLVAYRYANGPDLPVVAGHGGMQPEVLPWPLAALILAATATAMALILVMGYLRRQSARDPGRPADSGDATRAHRKS